MYVYNEKKSFELSAFSYLSQTWLFIIHRVRTKTNMRKAGEQNVRNVKEKNNKYGDISSNEENNSF